MKRTKLYAALGLVLSVSAMGALPVHAAGEPAGHEHAAHAPAKLTLNSGKKWVGDEPLRRAMGNIRDHLEQHRDATRGRADAAAYRRLAGAINTEVAYIFQNCRLEKRADDVLHLILTDIMRASEALEGKQPANPPAQAEQTIAHALENYARYFEHPGWQPLKH